MLSNMFDHQAQIFSLLVTSSLESSLPPSLCTGTLNILFIVSDILCVCLVSLYVLYKTQLIIIHQRLEMKCDTLCKKIV